MKPGYRVCMTGGCERRAVVWVTRFGQIKYVCSKCRDEMTSLMGWRQRKGPEE